MTERARMVELQPRVVIIGNADVNIDYGEFIDSSRHVLRFNLCRNFGRNTGTRTTVLVWINTGANGRDAYKKQTFRGWPPAEQAEEIWFRAPRQSLLQRAWLTLRHPRRRKQFFDYGAKILLANGMQHKPARYPSRAEYAAVQRKLLALGTARRHSILPSTGILGIERVLADPRFAGLEISLVGFNWFAGTQHRHPDAGHTFDEEEVLVRDYAAQGRLKILPGSEPSGDVRPRPAGATLEPR
ncbi:MAG: hypothetical protein H6841_10690 [Planctomycetes bacterium]|nr:hypothetical protein [Planctomycetota bacterium]